MERRRFLRTISYVPFFGIFWAILISASMIFTACGADDNSPAYAITDIGVAEDGETGEPGSMEEEGLLMYVAPTQNPHILVDRNGYSSKEEKTALIVAEDVPDFFSVVNEDTGKTVMTAVPNPKKLCSDGETYYAKLDFASVETPGNYYIVAGELGRSYSFQISDTYYEDIYENLVTLAFDRCNNHEALADEVLSLLYIYEKYPDTLPASSSDIPQVLLSVREWIGVQDYDAVSGEEAYKLISILSRFGTLYKKIDSQVATEALQKAVALYKEHADSATYPEAHFMAVVDLYKSSGQALYRDEIVSFTDYIEALEHPQDSRFLLYGSIGYMTTRQYVNKSLCDVLIGKLLEVGEDVVADKQLLDPLSKRPDAYLLLGYAQQVEALNYLLDAYEYNGLIVDIMHYLSYQNNIGYGIDCENDYLSDCLVIYAWLTDLERDGKLDSSALITWEYKW